MNHCNTNTYFSKFYGKVGIISWLLFHLIWKNYVQHWDFGSKSWIVDFFIRFTREKTPHNNFSHQTFSVENNYYFIQSKEQEIEGIGWKFSWCKKSTLGNSVDHHVVFVVIFTLSQQK